MRNVTGQVVDGDDFFDRQQDLQRFWSAVQTDNILLLAPRRIGKTSILRKMKAEAETHQFAAAVLWMWPTVTTNFASSRGYTQRFSNTAM